MKKRILYLPIKKEWFDLIAQGKKKEEYREDTVYWRRRFFEGIFGSYKHFTEVNFRNGYHKKSPFMRVGIIKINRALIDFENKSRQMFVVKLGKVLEIKNWRKKSQINTI